MCHKENLYFDVIKKVKLSLQKFVIFNMITDSFLVEKQGTCKEVRLQKLIKFRLSRWYSFWHFFSCLEMTNHLRRVSPPHFLQNVFIKTSEACFKKPFNFLNC